MIDIDSMLAFEKYIQDHIGDEWFLQNYEEQVDRLESKATVTARFSAHKLKSIINVMILSKTVDKLDIDLLSLSAGAKKYVHNWTGKPAWSLECPYSNGPVTLEVSFDVYFMRTLGNELIGRGGKS